jgi:hypothetical protein
VASGSAASCSALGAPTFGFHGSAVPTFDRRAVNPSGVPIFALAIALFVAGGLAIAGAFIWDP